MNFALILKKLREENKISQAELAKRLGIGTSTVAMWETGDRQPTTLLIEKVSAYFRVSIDSLLGLGNKPLPYNAEAVEIVHFPIIGKIRAGYGDIAVEEATDEFQEVPTSLIKGHSNILIITLRRIRNTVEFEKDYRLLKRVFVLLY